MKNLKKHSVLLALVLSLVLGFSGSAMAGTPSLGMATTYGILASTYTNTVAGTTVNGDVGFTTGPAIAPNGTQVNYGSGLPYATAGADQGTALAALASQGCTFTFAGGAIDLSTDITHGPVAVYAPGVYCSVGAMNISGPLTLNGNGTYIFRSAGALTTSAGSIITSSGAAACDVFWTPTGAVTLAANTTFFGTVIDDAGVTIGADAVWIGRALSFGGTISTDANTITVASCVIVPPLAPIVAPVIAPNNGGGLVAIPAAVSVAVSIPLAVIVPIVAPVVFSPTILPIMIPAPVLLAAAPIVPLLPDTGYPPREKSTGGGMLVFLCLAVLASTQLLMPFKK